MRTIAALALLLVVASPALAASRAPLDGAVSFHTGDSPAGADGRPTWVVTDPGSWAPVGAREALALGAGDVAWMRIDVPAGDWSSPALRLASLPSAAEVWADGTLLLRHGEVRPGATPRVGAPTGTLVALPPRLAQGGPVYVRLQLVGGLPYFPAPRLIVGDRDELTDSALRTGLAQFLFGAVFTLLGLVAVLAGLWRRTRAAIAPAGFFLSYGALLCGLGDFASVLLSPAWAWVGTAAISCTGVFVALLVRETLSGKLRAVLSKVLAGGVVVAVLNALLVLVVPAVALRFVPLAIVVFLLVMVTTVVAAIVEAARGGAEARIFLAGLAVLVALVVGDLLGVAAGDGGMNTHLGALALAMTFALIHVRRVRMTGEHLASRTDEVERRRVTTRERARTLERSVAELVNALTRLRGTTRAQHEGLVRQIAAIEESHVTIEEIRQTSAVAAMKAERLLEDAGRADVSARAGETALDASKAAALAMGAEVGEMSKVIDGLAPLTRRVAEAIGTVKDLATQSNMLALNANIEASRSGTEMPGALHVAREMRKLADQSVEATVRIRQMLESANERVADASGALAGGAGRVQSTLDELQTSAAQLRRLSGVVRETASAVRQISATVAQQHAGVGQIFTAVKDLSTQVREMSETVNLVEAAAGDVQHVVERMQTSLDRAGASKA